LTDTGGAGTLQLLVVGERAHDQMSDLAVHRLRKQKLKKKQGINNGLQRSGNLEISWPFFI
jgi:hypothetical protein